MKKEILKLFTVKNGISIQKEALKKLQEHIKDQQTLNTFFLEFKRKFNSSEVEVAMIDEIFCNSTEISNSFLIKHFKFQEKNANEDFFNLKNKIFHQIFSLPFLQENLQSCIFGIIYKNRNGIYILEDENDTIELEFQIQKPLFIFEGMFISLKGQKILIKNEENASIKFLVNDFILPDTKVSNHKNGFLSENKNKVCVVGGFNGEYEDINRVLDIEKPDILIISSRVEIDTKRVGKKERVLLVEDSMFPEIKQDISNPFILELQDKKIGFVSDEIFKNKKTGTFFNGDFLASFLRSFLSQGSLNPFFNSNFNLPEFPNYFIISQKTFPVVVEIEDVTFISLPSFGLKYYCILDFNSEKFEVKEI